jgi:3-phosphoshikimate 1-carboxyvinyltransferase
VSVYQVPFGRRAAGAVSVPASKSVTNRVLNLALLARRPLEIKRPLFADDTQTFTDALQTLGLRVEREGVDLRLAPGELPVAGEIWCGASGTMARFLTASLSTIAGSWRVDGTVRLRQRPLGPLLTALRAAGARIECLAEEGFLPIAIEGGVLDGGVIALDAGDSSQYLSALAMAGARARRPLTIAVGRLVSAPYVDLTLTTMRDFGIRIGRAEHGTLTVEPGLDPPPTLAVEADFSSACYFAAAAAVTGGEVELRGVRTDSHQGDRRFLELLERMGATVDWPASDRALVTGGGTLVAVDEDMSRMPDQMPTLAAIAPFARGVTRIENVAHLRIKESDRLAACASELRRLGARVDVRADGLTIPGDWAESEPPVEPADVATHGDHRIAMSFALTGLRRPGVSIDTPEVVAKSYPGFWKDLERCLSR